MVIRLDVYGPDLVTFIGSVSLARAPMWTDDWNDVGAGGFQLDTRLSPSLPNNILDPENLVVVHDTELDQDVFGWLIQRYSRSRGATYDTLNLAGPGLLDFVRKGLVYGRGGITGNPSDVRVFAWSSPDYIVGPGWGEPTSLGTYVNPTSSDLQGDPGQAGRNERQAIRLNPDMGPFPWGSSYPSPGGLQGTWRLSFRGKSTSLMPYNVTAAGVKSALEGLSNVDGVTVTGGGTTANPWVVEFTGSNVADKQHPVMGITHSGLRHAHRSDGRYVYRVQSGRVHIAAESLLDGWPDDLSEWLGPFGIQSYHRRVLRVDLRPAAAQEVIIWAVSTAPYTVYLDGEQISSGEKLQISRTQTTLFEVEHVVAFESTGPTMVTITGVNDEGDPTSVLYRTFTPAISGGAGSPEPWEAYGPDPPPGVTPGFIVKRLFEEAQERNALRSLTIDFDEVLDSAGRPWSETVELGLQVGNDSVLSAAERLRDIRAFPRLGPDRVLRLYDRYREDLTGSVGASLEEVGELASSADGEIINAILARTSDSWVEFHQVTGQPRYEGFLSLGTVPSDQSAIDIARNHLEDFIEVREVVEFFTSSATVRSTFRAYSSHGVGDLIIAPRSLDYGTMLEEWFYARSRVSAINATVEDNGAVRFDYEMEAGEVASLPASTVALSQPLPGLKQSIEGGMA